MQNTAISGDDNFPNLPGIDLAAGLAVVRGNILLYRKLLYKFRESFEDFEQQFRAACDEEDKGAAARAAHSLKGVASNIGAQGLMEAAFLLEKACETDKADTEQALNQAMTELRTVISGLKLLG